MQLRSSMSAWLTRNAVGLAELAGCVDQAFRFIVCSSRRTCNGNVHTLLTIPASCARKRGSGTSVCDLWRVGTRHQLFSAQHWRPQGIT